jgi:hypothetical protein
MAGIGVHQRTFSGLHRGDGPGFHVPVVAESIAMSFLKRIFSGGQSGSDGPTDDDAADPVDFDAAERARDLELARSEQDRLDELSQRQLRYAAYAWEPPKQGGERRADDGDTADRD